MPRLRKLRGPVVAVLIGLPIWLGLAGVSILLDAGRTGGSWETEAIKFLCIVVLSAFGTIAYTWPAHRFYRWYTGIWIGLVWALVTFGLDSLCYLLGLFPPSLGYGKYLGDVALSYLAMPGVAVLVILLINSEGRRADRRGE